MSVNVQRAWQLHEHWQGAAVQVANMVTFFAGLGEVGAVPGSGTRCTAGQCCCG
jgi:hypothetical protein